MYYIKQIIFSGRKVENAYLDLKQGLNIVYGPSDTGKSYIAEVVGFMMGEGKCRVDPNTGYDTVTMEIESDEGSLTIQRSIDGGKFYVTSNIENIDNGEYGQDAKSKKNISDVWLYLMGIKESQRIIGTAEYRDVALSILTLVHMLDVDENDISKEESVLLSRHDFGKMAPKSAILYFATDNNYWDGIKRDNRNTKATKKKAQIEYMLEFYQDMKGKREQYNLITNNFTKKELEEQIEKIISEIESAEGDISNALNKSREYADNIAHLDSQIIECNLMMERYESLQSQYSSDIDRLSFLVEGEANRLDMPTNVKCPFCNGELPKSVSVSCVDAAKAEIERLLPQINDLEDAIEEIEEEFNNLSEMKEDFISKRKKLKETIESELQPRLNELRKSLSEYTKTVENQKELAVYSSFVEDVGVRLRRLEEKKITQEIYDIEANFESVKFADDFINIFNSILQDCKYGEVESTYFSYYDFDVIINEKEKFRFGQGFRAYINTVVLLSIQEYLYKKGKHQFGVLAIDSPTLTLKEKPIVDEATPGMKQGLFQYMVDHQKEDQQIIIIENDIPDEDKVDYGNANLIYFTKDEHVGRYGLLPGVRS